MPQTLLKSSMIVFLIPTSRLKGNEWGTDGQSGETDGQRVETGQEKVETNKKRVGTDG